MRILLKGFVCDGNSSPSRRAVLIENSRIIAVEKDISGSSAADKCYSFKDEIIAPGFIDAHGHSDISIFTAPEAESKRSQGFTGEVSGNCGLSPFPLTGKNIDHIRHLYSGYGREITWETFSGYHQELSAQNVQLRLYPLCGHNTLRAAVAGYEKQELSPDEINRMKTLLDTTLRSGAYGLSTGLLYVPGCFAPETEIVELMRIVASHDKVFSTHLRSESDQLLESLAEILECAAAAKLKRVLISHFKTARPANWHKLDAALEMIDSYRRRGMEIRVDRYPYVESQTMLSVILPPPFDKMGDLEITRTFSDAAARNLAVAELRTKISSADWQRLRLTGAKSPAHRRYIGKFLSELPGDPAEICVEILADDATAATVSSAGMSAKNMQRILMLDYSMAGSDGNALKPDALFGNTHPRSFGTAAKFIRLLLDSGVPIEKTIGKLTTAPAEFFRLPDVGTIAAGNYADLTVFDPETIDSNADFLTPAQPAAGIVFTMLNGKITL